MLRTRALGRGREKEVPETDPHVAGTRPEDLRAEPVCCPGAASCRTDSFGSGSPCARVDSCGCSQFSPRELQPMLIGRAAVLLLLVVCWATIPS